jgi:HD-GYP domain-containing protein (c-di-GMP phosphodiesterase class II)/CHASE3 domain sensor protein
MSSKPAEVIAGGPVVGPNGSIFRRALIRAVGLPMAFMIGLAVFLSAEVCHLLAVAEWVDHSDRVIAQVFRVQQLLVDMETGLRGHLIGGSPSFLQPYDAAEPRVEAVLDDLSRSVADNPPQAGQVDELRADYRRWHAYTRELIARRARAEATSGEFATVIPRGKAIMDGIRARVDQLIGSEQRLRDRRSRAVRRTTRVMLGGGLVATLLLGGLLGLLARRQLVGLAGTYGAALATALQRFESLRVAGEEIRRLNATLEQRLERLDSLRRIDQAITASHDLRLTLEIVLDQVTARLGVDAAAVQLLDPYTCTLGYAAGRGFRGAVIGHSRLRMGEGYAGRVALDRRILVIPDRAAEVGGSPADCPLAEGFVAYCGVPLIAKGQVKGVLEAFGRSAMDPDPDWLDFFESLAGQAAIAVDNAGLFESLQRSNAMLITAYDATIEGWSRALDLRDHETDGHSRRVTAMAVRLAQAMGVQGRDLADLRRGALLHDIGKMGIPDAILLKPGPLDDEQREIMNRHPVYAYEWLSPVPFFRSGMEIPYGHHERWDGHGYPRKLKAEQIPLSARIFAAVDIWDALRSNRPYRRGWPEQRVRDHLRSLSGTHLDPRIVEVFLNLLDAPEVVPPLPTFGGSGTALDSSFAGG